jgi:hypothetical protein
MNAVPLTEAQRAKFNFVLNGPEDELALLSCSIFGDHVATICRITQEGNNFSIEPLFIELSQTLAANLLSPNGEPLLNLKGRV